MSFASETKKELARITPEKKCCMLAEIAGMIRVCGRVALAGGGKFKIRCTTETPAVARHFKMLIKSYFGVETTTEIGQAQTLKKGKYYTVVIGPEELSEQILRETGILMIREGRDYITDGIYEGLIKTKCCRKAYLRGAFLGAGTMTDPEKEYQLEIICGTELLSADLRKLFNTFVDIHARTMARKNLHVVYLKDSGQILDVLAIMGAQSQYFAYENVRLTKEMRNEANRRSNCDQANIDKAVAAAGKQIRAIKKIEMTRGLDSLPGKLRETAQVRLDNPDATLTELGEMMEPPLKKSGVNSRLKRIEGIAEKEDDAAETGKEKQICQKKKG